MPPYQLQVTILPGICEISRQGELDIHAIYLDQRKKGWSPKAACLMASILTKIPECLVQQTVKYKLENGIDGSQLAMLFHPKGGSAYGSFYCEKRLEMCDYFEKVNAEERDTWTYDEINHTNELAKELNVEVSTY